MESSSHARRPLAKARRGMLCALMVTSLVTLGMSAWVLHYSLVHTQTYLKSNPEVLFASAFNFLCVTVALTIGRHTFFTQVWCEVAWMAVSWFLYLGGIATLNTQTPGLLLSPCTGYFLCRGLLVMWIFGLFSLLAASALLFVTLSLAIWQTVKRRGHGRDVWTSRIDNWEGWNGTWTWDGRRETRRGVGVGVGVGGTGRSMKANIGPPQLPVTPTHVLGGDQHEREGKMAMESGSSGSGGGFADGIPHLMLRDDEGQEKHLSLSAYGTPQTRGDNPFDDDGRHV